LAVRIHTVSVCYSSCHKQNTSVTAVSFQNYFDVNVPKFVNSSSEWPYEMLKYIPSFSDYTKKNLEIRMKFGQP
jgi:hypothetical protein